MTTTYYAAQMFELTVHMLDHWDCGDYGCNGDCDLKCNVNIAQSCSGTTRLMPANRGALVMLFRCCQECEGAGRQDCLVHVQDQTVKLAEIVAREGMNGTPGAIMSWPETACRCSGR